MKQPQEVQCTECVFPSSSVVMTHKPESGGFGSIKTFFRSSSVSRILGGGGAWPNSYPKEGGVICVGGAPGGVDVLNTHTRQGHTH